MIGDRRAVMIVAIDLFPDSSVLESDHGVALDAVDAAVHAANECIEFGSRAGRVPMCFLRGLFGFLSPLIGLFNLVLGFLLRLLIRFLPRALAITLEVGVEMLQFVFA